MTKRNIAVTVALVVVLGAFFTFAPSSGKQSSGNNSLFSGFSMPFLDKVPSLGDSFTVTSAWSTFQDYLRFAKAHDIEGVKSLSYQISETCSNPEKTRECNVLMDSVYAFASGFKLEDFKNVSYDDKQIILSTDYMSVGEGLDEIKVVLYFVKNDQGEPKVLGIRFCYSSETEDPSCVRTNPEDRDLDNDGWWDDVEALFKR